MNKKKNVALYARVGNHDQLVDPVDFILAQAMRGEIQTLVVGTLERVCEDPERRQTIIKQLTEYGVEIVTAFDEEKVPRRCAIYNRYSVDNPERLAEVRGVLLTYCADTLGITDYVLFEEAGSVLEKREAFDDMVARIENGEFTDLVVYSIDRLFKPAYSTAKFWKIVKGINDRVDIHIVKKNP